MAYSDIIKKWKGLKLSNRRKKQGLNWLDWGTTESEDQGEPSTATLSLNCPVVHVMFESFRSLDVLPIKPLLKAAPHFVLACIVYVNCLSQGLLHS